MKKIAQPFSFFSLSHPFKKIKPLSRLTLLMLAINLLAVPCDAQQVIGSFPSMEGGFENATTATQASTVTVNSGVQLTAWTGAITANSTPSINTSSARSGNKSLTWVTSNSTSAALYSPTAPTTAIANSPSTYVVQFYWWKNFSGSARAFKTSISPDGTGQLGSEVNSATLGTSAISTAWTKETVVVTSGTSAVGTRYGLARFRPNGGTFSSGGYFIDDYVVYAGAVDITPAPDVTAPSATYVSSSQLNISWTAAATVDGGGYVVVRYTADPSDPINQTLATPNANGIYAVGNSVGPNGIVAYVGTGTSFPNTGLSANTFYYYRVYTVDKAFNFSTSPITFGNITAAAVSPALTFNIPGTPAASLDKSSVTDIVYNFNLTGSAHFTTLTQLTFSNAGSFDGNDFLNFKLYASSSSTFPVGATPLATLATPAFAPSYTFTGLTKIIPPAATGTVYFWITVDVGNAVNGTAGNYITVSPDLIPGNFTFLSATTVNTGSVVASGAQTIIAPAIYTWNGSLSTVWTVPGNWSPTRVTATIKPSDELIFPAGTFTATDVPTETIAALTINGNATLVPATTNTLTIKNTSGLGLPDLVVNAGASLTLSANLTTTLFDGSSADVSGVLNINASATYHTNNPNVITTVTNSTFPLTVNGIINNAGTLTSTTAARLIVKNGAVYNHQVNGGVLPTATWNTNSSCLISNMSSATSFSGQKQTFSKFIWDCPGQTATRFILTQNSSLTPPNFTVADSLIVKRTGGQILQLTYSSDQKDIKVGNYFQYGGQVALTYQTNDAAGQRSLTVDKTFYITDSLESNAKFYIINNATAEVTTGRLFINGDVEMHKTISSVTLEKAGTTSTAELHFQGSVPQYTRFDLTAGNINFVNNHTSTGVTMFGNATAYNFDLRQGVFYINGNTLTVNNAITYTSFGTGLFGGSPTSNLILGGAAGTLKFYTGYQILKDFTQTANSTASLGTELAIAPAGRDSLGIYAVLTTNDNLILRSDATGTARIAQIYTVMGVPLATINNKVTVERYLPMNLTSDSRRWRLLTAPFKSSTAPTIQAAWQEGTFCPDRTNPAPYDPKPGYGTHITVSNVMPPTNGFDHGSTNNPSIFHYSKAVASNWKAPASTTGIKVTDSLGVYMLFVRGDRSILIYNTLVAAKPTTLDPKGELNLGDISVAMDAASFKPIGNPYASQIKLDNVDFDGTPGGAKTIYLWDPKAVGSAGVGAFITCTGDGGSPASYTYTGNSSSYGSMPGVIESSGAFMVGPGTGNIVFHESDKTIKSSTIGVASRPTGNKSVIGSLGKISKLYIDLIGTRNGEPSLADGIAITYNGHYKNKIDEMDAAKLLTFSTRERISIQKEEGLYSIERRKAVNEKDTIQLYLSKLNTATYRMDFRPNDFDDEFTAYIEDRFTHTSTPVLLTENSSFSFDITNDSLSFATNRLFITFKRNRPAVIEPSSITVFPNPVTDGNIGIKIVGIPEGTYEARLLNNLGQVVYCNKVVLETEMNASAITLNKKVAKGIYRLELFSAGKRITTTNVMIQ